MGSWQDPCSVLLFSCQILQQYFRISPDTQYQLQTLQQICQRHSKRVNLLDYLDNECKSFRTAIIWIINKVTILSFKLKVRI
jgi:hypothetical protein